MEQQKNTGEKTAYTGRFGDRNAQQKSSPAAAPRRVNRSPDAQRRPTGFASPASGRARPAEKAVPEKRNDKPKGKPKKEKKAKQPRAPRQKKERRGLKALLALIAVVLMALVLIVIIFGGEDKTYHQMPTIERESIAAFEPEETPLPGAEVS